MNTICKHWRPCNVIGGGCCELKEFGGRPSMGICLNVCQKREATPVGLTVHGQDLSEYKIPKKPWKIPTPKQIYSYLKAEVSRILYKLPEVDVESRLKACSECPELMRSGKEGELGWCKACGCGTNARAELTIKATMPAATCPLKKWEK